MKIYIIGSVGSGKSTLARQLSHALSIPHFETDNFVWQRKGNGDVRNAEPVRDAQFFAAVTEPDWIIEGVHISWTDKAIQTAEVVVFLDIPYRQRTRRIVSRYLKQRVGVERSNYKPSFSILLKMFTWNRYFEETMKPVFLEKLELIPEKAWVLKSRSQVSEFLVKQI